MKRAGEPPARFFLCPEKAQGPNGKENRPGPGVLRSTRHGPARVRRQPVPRTRGAVRGTCPGAGRLNRSPDLANPPDGCVAGEEGEWAWERAGAASRSSGFSLVVGVSDPWRGGRHLLMQAPCHACHGSASPLDPLILKRLPVREIPAGGSACTGASAGASIPPQERGAEEPREG